MSLARYFARKLAEGTVTIVVGITLAFFLFRLLPGDPTAVFLDVRLSPEAKQILIREFGLDKPIHEQYFIFMENLLRGNLGISFVYRGTPVSKIIFGPKLFNTIVLMGSGMLLGAFISSVIGLLAGWKRGSLFDRAITSISYIGTSAPIFWIGLLVLLILGSYFRLIPMSGTISTEAIHADPLTKTLDYLWHLAGPLLVIAVYFLPTYMLYVRNNVVTLLGEDFIMVLKAKGMPDNTIVFKHILRHTMITIITLMAVQSPLLVTGAIITETIFGWNGIGLLLYDSVLKSDYPVVQGVFILTIIIVVVANLLADVAYAILDPRIRLTGRE